MVQQTRCPDEGANYHRLIRRAGTTTVLGILTFTGTVAAQSDGTGNPLGEFISAFGTEIYPTLILGLFIFTVLTLVVSGFPIIPTYAKSLLRSSAALGAVVLVVGVLAPDLLQWLLDIAGTDVEISVWGFIIVPLAL